MTYSYYRQGGAMRALALLLASALIVALVWFVSYKNGCVTCSSSDTSGSDKKQLSCQACPSDEEVEDAKRQSGEETSGTETGVAVTGVENGGSEDGEDNDNRKVSFEVVIDGRSTRFEVDLDNLEDHKINVTSEDGVSAVFEKGSSTDVKVTVDTAGTDGENKAQPAPAPVDSVQPAEDQQPAEDAQPAEDQQPAEDTQPAAAEDQQPAEEEPQPVSDIINDSDIASTNDSKPVQAAYEEEDVMPQPTFNPFSSELPAVTLLDGADFGMEGRVLALGKGSERRGGIVAVIPEEGHTVALLCETMTTAAEIASVKAQYPDRIVYTYTIDREFFVNLRGNSRFALHNCPNAINIQPGIDTPEWLTYQTETISDEQVGSYIAKNELERYHVKGTKGCLVICESNDVFRYNWDKHGNYR